MPFTLRLIPAAVAAALLAACGGGGGSPPGGGTPPVTASSGVAVDGYLQFATVLCDSNGNGVADAGERGAGTNAAGQFTFSPECTAALVVTGGTNADTGLPFTGVLKAPAGATVVSPLTTLLVEGLAAAQLAATFGLPADVDVVSTDPAATAGGALLSPELFRKTLALQHLVQKTAGVMVDLSGQGSPPVAQVQATYAAVAKAFAAALGSGSPLASGATIDAAALARAIEAAVPAAAALFPVGAAVNAATLAEIVSGGLALQAESILRASAGELTSVVAATQASDAVGDFVAMHLAELAGPPGSGSAALAAQLSAQVDPWVALDGDAIRLVNGGTGTAYTLSQFESEAGIGISWPLPEPVMLEVTLANAQYYHPVPGQTVSAAVSITETAAGGQGTILALLENVAITRAGNALKLTVPAAPTARVYGVSSDGAKKAVVNFANGARNVTGTFNSAPAVPTSFPLGNIVNYTINQLSNDFTGIYSLRGKYRVQVVLSGLSLRRADGTLLPPASITVPTAIGPSGEATTSRTISGRGLTGYVTLAD
jgi:hypothetical protein